MLVLVAGILGTYKLYDYRLDRIEKKLDVHNQMQDRLLKLEIKEEEREERENGQP